MRKERFDQDKLKVLEWFQKYAHGYKNARTRDDIIPFIQLPDRYFREIASSLIHDGHIASSCDKGYWFIPLFTKDRREVEAVIKCHIERKSKALDLIKDCDKLIQQFEDRLVVTTQGQREFVGV